MGWFSNDSKPKVYKIYGTPIGDPANRPQEVINARIADGKGHRCDYVNGRGKECRTTRESGNTRCRAHMTKP